MRRQRRRSFRETDTEGGDDSSSSLSFLGRSDRNGEGRRESRARAHPGHNPWGGLRVERTRAPTPVCTCPVSARPEKKLKPVSRPAAATSSGGERRSRVGDRDARRRHLTDRLSCCTPRPFFPSMALLASAAHGVAERGAGVVCSLSLTHNASPSATKLGPRRLVRSPAATRTRTRSDPSRHRRRRP